MGAEEEEYNKEEPNFTPNIITMFNVCNVLQHLAYKSALNDRSKSRKTLMNLKMATQKSLLKSPLIKYNIIKRR